MKKAGFAALAAFLLSAVFHLPTSRALGPLAISFIDVGQGDAILIQDPYRFDILIDGGTTTGGDAVVEYLRELAVDDVDVMIATHADADHIGGLTTVLSMTDIPVQQVYYNGYQGNSNTWTKFVAAVEAAELILTPMQYPEIFRWGDITAAVLNPEPDLVEPETNESCVVLSLSYGMHTFLFTCDISTEDEEALLDGGREVRANVLKVAHHGSKNSSCSRFLSAVGMQDAIISVGLRNQYGHPAPETLARIAEAGANIYRTDLHGTVMLTSDGSSYTITPSKVVFEFEVYLPVVVRE